ncbi:MAG: radical SAM protein [Nanoarchaeota archaeon]
MINTFNVVWLALTYNCNNKCSWCYSSSNTLKEKKILEKNKIIPILDLLDNLNIKRTILIGGEPTIYPYLDEVLFEHKKRGIKTGLVTNGRILSNKEFSRSLLEKEVSYLTVSIEGYDSKSHDKITNIPGSYLESINGIKIANEIGIKVSSNTVISKENCNDLEKILNSLISLPLNTISFNLCGPCLNNENKDLLNPYEASKYFKKIYLYAQENNKKINLVTPTPLCFFEKEIRNEMTSSTP